VWIDRQQGAVVCRKAGARRGQTGGTGYKLALASIGADAGVHQCVVNGRIDHTTVVHSPTAANTSLSITAQIVGKADAWSKVVAIVDFVVRLRQGRIYVYR